MNAILDGIKKFYRAGYLHKDIKSDNIHYDEKTNKIYFLDFGLSKKIFTNHELEREFHRLEEFLLEPLKRYIGNNRYNEAITEIHEIKLRLKIGNALRNRISQLENDKNIFLSTPKEKINLLKLLCKKILNDSDKSPQEIIKEFENHIETKEDKTNTRTNGEILRSPRNFFSIFTREQPTTTTSDLLNVICAEFCRH